MIGLCGRGDNDEKKQRDLADKFSLLMKIRVTRSYRKQIAKPLVNKLLTLQLLIERELLPRMKEEVEWNQKFYKFGWEEFLRTKQLVRLQR